MKFKVYDKDRNRYVEDQTYFLIKSDGTLMYGDGNVCGVAINHSIVFFPEEGDIVTNDPSYTPEGIPRPAAWETLPDRV